MENREQLRARHAHQKVSQIRQVADKDKKDKYSNLAKKLPAMIHNNGLIASLAFVQAKGPDDLLSHLHAWLRQVNSEIPATHSDLVQHLVNLDDSLDLLPLTHEAIALTGWIKRMVETLMPDA